VKEASSRLAALVLRSRAVLAGRRSRCSCLGTSGGSGGVPARGRAAPRRSVAPPGAPRRMARPPPRIRGAPGERSRVGADLYPRHLPARFLETQQSLPVPQPTSRRRPSPEGMMASFPAAHAESPPLEAGGGRGPPPGPAPVAPVPPAETGSRKTLQERQPDSPMKRSRPAGIRSRPVRAGCKMIIVLVR